MRISDEVSLRLGGDGAAAVTHYVALRSGLGSQVGESHLVLGERLRVFGKSSLFSMMVELDGVSSARLLRSSYRQELVLVHRDGSTTIEIDVGEEEAVIALLETFHSTPAAELQPSRGERPEQRWNDEPGATHEELREVRERLLGWLASAALLRRTRTALVALLEERRRARRRALVERMQRSKTQAARRELEGELREHTARMADAPRPDSPRSSSDERTAERRAVRSSTSHARRGASLIPLFLLVALVLTSLGAALFVALARK